MAEYYLKNSVDSIINNFGDDDIQKAISYLDVYNDRALKEEEAEREAEEDKDYQWQNIRKIVSFVPVVGNDDFFMKRWVFATATCPACGARITIDDYDNYCPRCGASMTYVEDD